jgi:hypothetical protein
MTVPQKIPPAADIMEAVLLKGDLNKLTSDERVQYYNAVCHSLGLNPLTRPLEYITLQGKGVLYARRDCADQLRKLNGISIAIVSQDMSDDLLTVHVRATDKHGRADEDLGAVSFVYPVRYKDSKGEWRAHPHAGKTLMYEDRANAILKCITKAKRRVTLSISGLGFLDETEVAVAEPFRPTPPAPNVMLMDPAPSADVETQSAAGDAAVPAAAEAASPETPLPGIPRVAEGEAAQSRPTIEEEAKREARRGSIAFRAFYRNCEGFEQARVNAIGDELRELMRAADQKLAADRANDDAR